MPLTQINTENSRFFDEGKSIDEFSEELLIFCPKCGSPAKVVPISTEFSTWREKIFSPRKTVCGHCPYRAEHNGKSISIGASVDWYFRLPLRLQIECCGGRRLWAYNEKHLEFIENYVAAKLRERKPHSNSSLASRLPQWIKSAKNREEILKAIKKMKEMLVVSG